MLTLEKKQNNSNKNQVIIYSDNLYTVDHQNFYEKIDTILDSIYGCLFLNLLCFILSVTLHYINTEWAIPVFFQTGGG